MVIGKVKHSLSRRPGNSTLGYTPVRLEDRYSNSKVHTRSLFTEALFTKAKRWKQPEAHQHG